MKSKLKQLFEAHVEHEMEQWGSPEALRREIEFAFDTLGALKVGDVFQRSQIDLAIAEIRGMSVSPDALTFLQNAVKGLRKAASESRETTDRLTTKEIHNQWVNVLIESKNLRTDMARDFARSLFFKRLMSEVLVFSIRRFLSEDNSIAKSIPGVSSLFKFGQNLVSQAIPNLDENIGRVVRDFVGKNIDSMSSYAEKVLTTEMDEKMIREISDALWDDLAKRPISRLADDLEPLQGENVSHAITASVKHFQQTTLFEKLLRALFESWFDHYEDMEIKAALEKGGITREKFISTVLPFAEPAVTAAVESGALREIVRKRLQGFYESDAAKSIL